jgi:hypothetical protein
MASDLWAPPAIDLPDGVVAGLIAELDAPSPASPLAPLLTEALATADVGRHAYVEEHGLIEGDELAPWLAQALSVLLWPELLLRAHDTVLHPDSMFFAAADRFVFYGHADGVCSIGRPVSRDAAIDELAATVTALERRSGDPAVLELSHLALQAIDLVLRTDGTRDAALAALTPMSSSPDAPAKILDALVADRVMVTAGPDHLGPGPAIAGWEQVLDARHRLEIQRMDLDVGTEDALVRTMVFLGPPGDRCLLIPEDVDDALLAVPTRDETQALIDAFLSPVPVEDDDPFAEVRAAWRADADTIAQEAR